MTTRSSHYAANCVPNPKLSKASNQDRSTMIAKDFRPECPNIREHSYRDWSFKRNGERGRQRLQRRLPIHSCLRESGRPLANRSSTNDPRATLNVVPTARGRPSRCNRLASVSDPCQFLKDATGWRFRASRSDQRAGLEELSHTRRES